MATDMGPGQWIRRIMHGSRLVCREDAAVAHGALSVESVHRACWLNWLLSDSCSHLGRKKKKKLIETVEWVYKWTSKSHMAQNPIAGCTIG